MDNNQLLEIQEQNAKEAQTRVMLAKEVEKYQGYDGYENLKKLIENCLIRTLIQIRKNNFQKIEKGIKEMHQEILLIFHTYHTQKQVVQELSKDVYGSKDKPIKNYYEKLNRNFMNGQDFSDTKEAIEHTQSLIDEQKRNKTK